MDGFFYVAFLIYSILAVLGAAFLITIGPALVVEAMSFLSRIPDIVKQKLHPSNNELVEHLFLIVEELREWRHVPGRHRSVSSGVYRPDDTFFAELLDKWTNEDPLCEKELVNA